LKCYIDSSVFLHLLLEGDRADEAEEILERVENGEVTGYITVLVAEEVAFKLLVAKASELGVDEFWSFKKRFLKDSEFRGKCYEPIMEFREYLDKMAGLVWVPVADREYWEALKIVRKYGLLTVDAIHAATALKLGVPLASFDEDFKRVPGLKVIP